MLVFSLMGMTVSFLPDEISPCRTILRDLGSTMIRQYERERLLKSTQQLFFSDQEGGVKFATCGEEVLLSISPGCYIWLKPYL
jgi:hypothetical protein